MAGSEAEERIRGKAEAALRLALPEARIIHELVLRQGGVRIDLAAVTPDRLVCVEIKSERDVLKRLPEQVKAMRLVADAWFVCCATKHLEEVRKIAGWANAMPETQLDAPGYQMRDLTRDMLKGLCNAPARLEMLWANELHRVAGLGKGTRGFCVRAASDSRTGSEIRRAVCAELRARHFPRADAPIPAKYGLAA